MCSCVLVVNMPAYAQCIGAWVMSSMGVLTPRGMVRAIDCWRLPAAGDKGTYVITDVNPCRNPTVDMVIDIQPLNPSTTVQQSNAQSGEQRFLHRGTWAVSAARSASKLIYLDVFPASLSI